MATWVVYEYARLYRGNRTEYAEQNLVLSAKQFDSIKQLIVADESDHDKLFRYGFERGQEVLVCQNYVGVICLPDGDQIEILPKTHKHSFAESSSEAIEANRHNLVKMLISTRHLPCKSASAASLDVARMSLLDVFIHLFLLEVNKVVKQGIARNYETQEENLAYIKGKLLVSQQLRQNLINKHRHYMAYDELTENRPENRLIRSALNWSLRRVKGAAEHLCQELLFHFSSIPHSRTIPQDMNAWQRGRHLRHYEPIRPWLEMIFNHQSPTSISGSKDMLSLLFPMERVFESYVAQQLKRQYPRINITSQAKKCYLLRHTPRKSAFEKDMFQLKPDLVMSDNDKTVIADTKWKLIDENKPGEKYNIKESDIYQMLAYNQTYQIGQQQAEVWLIYPKTDKFSQPIPDFRFENGSIIKVIPFDIEISSLVGYGLRQAFDVSSL